MKSSRWILGMVLIACVAGCAETRHSAKPEATSASPEALRRERERKPLPPAIPDPPRPPVVASKGDCAPPADKQTAVSACCNDRPCIGECVETAPGKIECDCYGTRGGCAVGLVCCQYRLACVKPEECDVP
jgi:hypothetical protein